MNQVEFGTMADKRPLSDQRDYLSAADALQVLQVRKQTLYAYVSRGWIRSVVQPGRRERLYLREDVERARARSQARSGHAAVAASAMNWGEPIIPTSITEITPQGPRYRGRSAVELARSGASFEAVAELLWSGIWHDRPFRWPVASVPQASVAAAIPALTSSDQLLELFAVATLELGMMRGSITDRVLGGRTFDAARQVIQALTCNLGRLSPARRHAPLRNGESIAQGVVRALALKDTLQTHEAIRTMLILFADHELSPAALAARVAASSGATVHSCIAAALCVSSGIRLGRIYDDIEHFLNAPSKRSLMAQAQRSRQRGALVPGFSHPLYPRGDPRGLLLLEMAKQHTNQSKRLSLIFRFIEEAADGLELFPRHELGVITLATAIGMPPFSAGALFVVARIAGWVAHVQEQRLSGMMLRPRAKYVAG